MGDECEHGNLRRSCELCLAHDEIDDLRRRLQEAERALFVAESNLDYWKERAEEDEHRINRADRYLALGSPSGAREALAQSSETSGPGEGEESPEYCPHCGYYCSGKTAFCTKHPDTTRATTGEHQPVLPDCMVPDGADSCEGYRLLQSEPEATRLARDELERFYANAIKLAGRTLTEPTGDSQESGEALAAFDKALDWLIPDDTNTNTQPYMEALPLLQKVRQHLQREEQAQAGVPESPKLVCKGWDCSVSTIRRFRAALVEQDWEKADKLQDHIEEALAAHSNDSCGDSGGHECVWHKPDPEEEFYETTCGSAWDAPDGMTLAEFPTMRYCSSCARRIVAIEREHWHDDR